MKCGDNGFVLKLKTLAHDEELNTKTLQQHGDIISLIGVYGKAPNFQRERLLGYILLYIGTPVIHSHPWYLGICYSGEDDIRRKDPTPLLSDDNVRFFKVGIGVFDYLLTYKARTKEHDEAGFSDGATHLETAADWKDGL